MVFIQMNKTINSAFILAAGLGTRLRPLTLSKPKPLLPVQGQPIIDRLVKQLQALGIEKLYVNAHYLGEQIIEHFTGTDVTVIYEPELLETGGGVANALRYIKDDAILIVNSDIFFSDTLALDKLLTTYQMNMPMLLLLQKNANQDFALRQDNTIYRALTPEERSYGFTGAYIMHRKIMQDIAIEPFSITKLWFKTANEHLPYYGVVNDMRTEIIDIGTHATYNMLQSYAEK